jgi:hypothetical protein
MAPIIPSLQLFIVTSALNPNMGVLNRQQRLEQTIEGLISLREKCPDAVVILADGSPEKVEREKYDSMSQWVNLIADFSGDKDIAQFASTGRKSEAENLLMLKMMMLMKQSPELMKLMYSVRRIYKFSARTTLHDEFDVAEHDHFGKYVFKKRMPTWLGGDVAETFTDLLITRLFSFCPSLIDDYSIVCRRNIGVIQDAGVDTEHAHFFNIEPDRLVELDKIHCQGVMASTGAIEIY